MVRVAMPALVCVAAWGCSASVQRYFARRGTDLADCLVAEAGLGSPLSLILSPVEEVDRQEPSWSEDVSFTSFAGAPTESGGEPRRRGMPPMCLCCVVLMPKAYARVRVTDFAVVGLGWAQPVRYGWRGRYGSPGASGVEESGFPFIHNREKGGGISTETKMGVTTRTYERGEPGPRGKIAEKFWIGAAATLLLSARVGFNPVEFADFVAGWFGRDMLQDDDWVPTEQQGKKEQPKKEAEAKE